MSSVEIQSVLSQLRALQARSSAGSEAQGPQATERKDFGELIGQAVNHVSEAQQNSAATARAFEMGDPNVSLADVMLASSRSQVEFTALTQVRNRMVRAYQDIMNMPI
ncbi:MAG: flagellar hook-basal body complex protein FliE [Nevskiales bacterium]